jgi:hypothetical protein
MSSPAIKYELFYKKSFSFFNGLLVLASVTLLSTLAQGNIMLSRFSFSLPMNKALSTSWNR